MERKRPSHCIAIVWASRSATVDPGRHEPVSELFPKWVRGFVLTCEDRPGLSEPIGYYHYSDRWREQRYGYD